MRPVTAALAILVIVAAAAVALAVWASSRASDPSASPPPSGEAPTDRPTAEATATPEPEYDYPTADSVGACFDPIYHYIDGSLLAMRLLDCDEPHLAELLGVEEVDASATADWPGQDSVDEEAEASCRDVFLEYVGVRYERSSVEMIYYSPTEESWLSGDRQIWCFADTTSASPFTSSVRNLRE
jgi:hypothetical protein